MHTCVLGVPLLFSVDGGAEGAGLQREVMGTEAVMKGPSQTSSSRDSLTLTSTDTPVSLSLTTPLLSWLDWVSFT